MSERLDSKSSFIVQQQMNPWPSLSEAVTDCIRLRTTHSFMLLNVHRKLMAY